MKIISYQIINKINTTLTYTRTYYLDTPIRNGADYLKMVRDIAKICGTDHFKSTVVILNIFETDE